jgi:hypothetical protein
LNRPEASGDFQHKLASHFGNDLQLLYAGIHFFQTNLLKAQPYYTDKHGCSQSQAKYGQTRPTQLTGEMNPTRSKSQ